MTALADLAYTTAGGIIGAAVTTYLSRTHERRQLRAEVQHHLHRLAAVRDDVREVRPSGPADGRPAQLMGGVKLLATAEFGVRAVLEDGRDAERALREALEGLVVASLSAGIPRRVLDFAGGGEERALQCEVIRLLDLRAGGTLGDGLDPLMASCDAYRRDTAQLLLHALWHPWRIRLLMHARIRRLRGRVAALHERQAAAMAALARDRDGRG